MSVNELFTYRKCPRDNVGTSLAKQSIVFEKSNYESAFVSPSPPLCCWRLVFTQPASAVRCSRTGVLNCENQEIVVPCISHKLIYPNDAAKNDINIINKGLYYLFTFKKLLVFDELCADGL